jgi:hypothetical protein
MCVYVLSIHFSLFCPARSVTPPRPPPSLPPFSPRPLSTLHQLRSKRQIKMSLLALKNTREPWGGALSDGKRLAGYRMPQPQLCSIRQHTSAYVSIRQHTSAYVSIRLHTSAYINIRQHTSAYVSIRQHTSAYVSIRDS